MLFRVPHGGRQRGRTPVADSPAVLGALPADLVGGSSRRLAPDPANYNADIGASLADAFGTDDRGAVESYCRAMRSTSSGDRTRVAHTAAPPRVVPTPDQRPALLFNQIAFLNEWTLAPELREYLVGRYGEDGLPFNTRFGNGDRSARNRPDDQPGVRSAHRLRAVGGRRPAAVDNIRTRTRENPSRPRESWSRWPTRAPGRFGRHSINVSFYENEQRSPCEATRQRLPSEDAAHQRVAPRGGCL